MSLRNRPLLVTAAAMLVAAFGLALAGCGSLVGVRATILDEPTRLEREVLGERAILDRGAVLLPLAPAASGEAERTELLALEAAGRRQWDKLSEVSPQQFGTRLWQAVVLHNLGVTHARLGDGEKAEALLALAHSYCELYALDTLRWQVLHTLADLRGGEAGYALRLQAAEAVEAAALLTEFEYDVDAAGRRDALYGELIAASLTKKDQLPRSLGR